MNSFKSKTVSGLKWNLTNRLSSQFLSLVLGIILARLLSPEEFGIIGMVTVFSGFAGVFVDFGFTSAIIQNRDSDSRHWSSVFWLNIGISLSLAVLFSLFAPLMADFFEQPLLKNVTIAIAWTLFISSFGLVQMSLLKKALKFKEIASIDLISQLMAGVIAITAAYNGFSYWSLVIQIYISSILRVGLFWIRSNWHPSFVLDRGAINELVGFSLPLIGMKSTHYWTHNIDSLIVGKVLGDSALGIYSRAYSLMLVPLQSISRVISSVMFPAYSLIQDDPDRIKRIYVSINRVIALITFPMMFGLVVTAEPFIYVLLGEKWTGVIPIIQVLAPLGAWRSVHSLSGNVFMARGKTNLLFRITLPSSFFVAVSMLFGIYTYGLIGLAVAYSISSLIIGLALDFYLKKIIGLGFVKNLGSLLPIFIAAGIMTITVFLADVYYFNSFPNLLRLICLVVIGIAIYGGALLGLGLKKELITAYKQVKK